MPHEDTLSLLKVAIQPQQQQNKKKEKQLVHNYGRWQSTIFPTPKAAAHNMRYFLLFDRLPFQSGNPCQERLMLGVLSKLSYVSQGPLHIDVSSGLGGGSS